MPADRVDAASRRSVVPEAASRSLWLAAAWTGVGTALIGMAVAIAAVGVLWLPASGSAGSAGSAVRAGVLTFLAALHGGVTVGGLPSAFVPLGLTVIAGALAWRAGSGLADAVHALDEDRPARLWWAGGVQAGTFAITCAFAAAIVHLGTSSASVPGALLAGLLLFAVTGGTAYVKWSPLADEFLNRAPSWLPTVVRATAAAITCYLGAGALLVAGSLVMHHGQVETLSRQIGGGWSGLPVLLLGVLAAPNAVIAAASYLAGPGFAVGSGVSLGSHAHGTLPAFPILGAVPSGPAGTVVWLLAALTPLAAGASVVRVVGRGDDWRARFRDAGLTLAGTAVAGCVVAWQGGGRIGSGALTTVGASPWQFGLATAAGTAVVAGAALVAFAALAWIRGRAGADDDDTDERPWLTAVAAPRRAEPDDGKADQLAG